MANISITYTFSATSTISSSQVNTNFSDVSTYLNNRNSGSSSWDTVYALSASAVPLVIDNSSGSQNIANFKTSGSTVVAVGPTGKVIIGGTSPTLGFLEVRGPTTTYNSDSGQIVISDSSTTGKRLAMGYDTAIDGGYFQATNSGVGVKPIFLNANSGGVVIGHTSINGTGTVLQVRQASNIDLFVTPATSVSGAIGISAANDGLNSNIPLEIRSSFTAFTSGSVAVGSTVSSENTKAILELVSTTKGFLPPRLTTTQRDAISAPTEGLTIYNTSTHKLNVFTTGWEAVTSA